MGSKYWSDTPSAILHHLHQQHLQPVHHFRRHHYAVVVCRHHHHHHHHVVIARRPHVILSSHSLCYCITPLFQPYSLTALALGLQVDQKKGDNRITTGNTAQKCARGPCSHIYFSEIVLRYFRAKMLQT